MVPGEEAQQRQVQLVPGVALGDAAQAQDHGAGRDHLRLVRGEAGELQRQIGHHGGVHLAGAAGVDGPAAVGLLFLQDVLYALRLDLEVDLPQPVHVEDVVGGQGAVDHQLAAPMAVRLLEAQEVLLGEEGSLERLLVEGDLVLHHEEILGALLDRTGRLGRGRFGHSAKLGGARGVSIRLVSPNLPYSTFRTSIS